MKTKALMVAALVMLSACGSDPTDPLAEFEPQVNNAADNFQLQASDVADVGATLQYTWGHSHR